MRLGLIGLGRIGAFHAQTLTDLPVVDSLVVLLLSDRSGVVTGSIIDWDQNVLGGAD